MTPNFQYSNGGLKGKKKRRQNKEYFNSKNYIFDHNPQKLDVLDRIREAQTRKRVPRLPIKCFEYSQQYETVLPSAPALRSLPKTTVDAVVSRLSRSKKETAQLQKSGGMKKNLTKSNYDKKDTCINVNTLSQQSFSCCSYYDSPPLPSKGKQVTKTPGQIRKMVERLSATKLHDSDFRMGKLIRFRSVQFINSSEVSYSRFPSLMSFASGTGATRSFPTISSSVSADTFPIRLPPINPIGSEDESEINHISPEEGSEIIRCSPEGESKIKPVIIEKVSEIRPVTSEEENRFKQSNSEEENEIKSMTAEEKNKIKTFSSKGESKTKPVIIEEVNKTRPGRSEDEYEVKFIIREEESEIKSIIFHEENKIKLNQKVNDVSPSSSERDDVTKHNIIGDASGIRPIIHEETSESEHNVQR